MINREAEIQKEETLVNCGCTWNWDGLAQNYGGAPATQTRQIGVCLPEHLNIHLAEDARRQEILDMPIEEYEKAVDEFCTTVGRSHQIAVMGYVKDQACGHFNVPEVYEDEDGMERPGCQAQPWALEGSSGSMADPLCELPCESIPCTSDNCDPSTVLIESGEDRGVYYERCECTEVEGCGEPSTMMCRPALSSFVDPLPTSLTISQGFGFGMLATESNRTGVLTALAARPRTFEIDDGSEAFVEAEACERILGVKICATASATSTVGGRMDFYGPPCAEGACEMDVEIWLQGTPIVLDFRKGPFSHSEYVSDLKVVARTTSGGVRIVDGHATIPAGELAITASAVSDNRGEGARVIDTNPEPIEFDIDFESGTVNMPQAEIAFDPHRITMKLGAIQPDPWLSVSAGNDIVVECEGEEAAQVDLNASTSDPAALVAWWRGAAFTEELPEPTFSSRTVEDMASLGTNLYTVTAMTPTALDAGTINVTVADTTPPELYVEVSPDVIWPPNHAMVEVSVDVAAFDQCEGTVDAELVSVTSNEPPDWRGDGRTKSDVKVTPDGRIFVRAERSALGEGRVYSIVYRAMDGSGNVAEVEAYVSVPMVAPTRGR